MIWTTPEDLRKQIQRRWDRGELLVPPPAAPLFPMALRLRRPKKKRNLRYHVNGDGLTLPLSRFEFPFVEGFDSARVQARVDASEDSQLIHMTVG